MSHSHPTIDELPDGGESIAYVCVAMVLDGLGMQDLAGLRTDKRKAFANRHQLPADELDAAHRLFERTAHRSIRQEETSDMNAISGSLNVEALTSLATCDTEEARMRAFSLLPHEQQIQAIQRLASSGMSDAAIARATRMSVEAICRLLADRGATRPLFESGT